MRGARTAVRVAAVRVVAVALALQMAPAPVAAQRPTLDDESRAQLRRIVESRGFTRGVPRKPIPSVDGKHVYFLRSGAAESQQKLYVFEVATGHERLFLEASQLSETETISHQEQARRERQRESESGITSFTLSRDGRGVLVPYSGDVFWVSTRDGRVRRLLETPEIEIDPRLSPDGQLLSFVRDRRLVVRHLASGREAGPDSPLATGIAEHIAQEEMDRDTGQWWSPDSRWLAFMEVDETNVPRFRVPDFIDETGEGHTGPYPKPGDANAKVRVGFIDVSALVAVSTEGTEPVRLQPKWPPPFPADVEYVTRVDWGPHSGALWVQTMPRSQQRLDVRRFDFESGNWSVLLQEEDVDWINLHDNFHALDDGRRFLWTSERTGHRHLELIGATGDRLRRLTSGAWDVADVLHVDEERQEVFFSGNRGDTRELHVYRVGLAGGEVKRLTETAGWHLGSFHDANGSVFVDSASDEHTPTRVFVRSANGKLLGTIPTHAAVPETADLVSPPELHRLQVGEVELDVVLHRPPDLAAGARAPLVVYVYAGPHAQQVRRKWAGERGLFDRWLAPRGFFVARIDGRGTWGRGHDSERIFSGVMGTRELADQVAGVGALLETIPAIDPDRVGVWGWSYGGYMTLMALTREPNLFKAGVSVAPVVDWRGYDTFYTERYLGLPKDNTSGYDISSVLTYVPQLRTHLTLVHGASDDNVHLRESMLLVNELVAAGKQFDLMIYPGTHMIQTVAERSHLYELVWRTFAEHL